MKFIILTLSVFILLYPVEILSLANPDLMCVDCSDVRKDKCVSLPDHAKRLIEHYEKNGIIAKAGDEAANPYTKDCLNPHYKIIDAKDPLCMPDESNECKVISHTYLAEISMLRQGVCTGCFETCECQENNSDSYQLRHFYPKLLLSLSICVFKFMN